MDESNQDEKLKVATRYAVAMHLEANRKVGQLARYITIVAVLISIFTKSFWPMGIAAILCVVIYFYLIQSCMNFVERQTGMPIGLQAHYSRQYKTDPQFAKEVDELHAKGSDFARHL